MRAFSSFFRLTSFLLGSVFATGLVIMMTVAAVDHYGVFELEGDVVDGGAAGEDWSTIYDHYVDPNNPTEAGAVLFIPNTEEGPGPDISYLKTGSKDTLDLEDWDIEPTDVAGSKTEIMDAFAAAYLADHDNDLNTPPHFVTYFGFTRESNEGNATGSFWLFKEETNIIQVAGGDTPNDPSDDDYAFDRNHSIGDILLTTTYEKGGSEPITFAYKWIGGKKPLEPLGDVSQACDPTNPGSHPEPYCSAVNNINVPSYWPFQGKNTPPNSLDPRMLLEGGVDLTEVLRDELGCFATFLAGTRTSQSLTASIKDIAIGAFDTCAISVEKKGDVLAKYGAAPEDDAEFTITIKNDGLVPMYLKSVTDTVVKDDGNDTLVAGPFNLLKGEAGHAMVSDLNGCTLALREKLDPNAECSFKVTFKVTDPNLVGSLLNKVAVVYTQKSDGTGDERTANDDHAFEVFKPLISVTKDSVTTLSTPGRDVDYEVTIENISSDNSPNLLFYSFEDTLVASQDISIPTACDELAVGADCTVTYTYTIPESAANPMENVATAHYNPSGFSNDIKDDDNHIVHLFYPAVEVEKTSDTNLSKAGDGTIGFDKVVYTFTVRNVGTNDSNGIVPDLKVVSFDDDVLGDLTSYIGDCDVLVKGDPDCSFDVPVSFYKAGGATDGVAETLDIPVTGDNDTWPWAQTVANRVDVVYEVDGNEFSGVTVDDFAEHSVDLFEPSYTLGLSCVTTAPIAGQNVTYEATITNTSSPNTPTLEPVNVTREITREDPISGTVTIAVLAGADPLPSLAIGDSETVRFSGQSDAAGTFTGEISTRYSPVGYSNILDRDDSADCTVLPAAGFFVIEKRLLEQSGIEFIFDAQIQGATLPVTTALTPVFNNAEADTTVLSPVDKVVDGFDRQDGTTRVDLDLIGDTKTVVITERSVVGTRLVDSPIGIECDGGQAVPDYANRKVTITVGHDDTITCRMTNEELGRILIDKITYPAEPDLNNSQLFDFSLTGGDSALNQTFQLADASAKHDSGYVIASDGYKAAENNVPEGWDLTDSYCDNGSDVGNIKVGRGETVTCTFENTKRGKITLVKTTIGGNGTFDYTHDVPGLKTSLTTVGNSASDDSDLLKPGVYSIAEDAYPTGEWEQSSAPYCDDGSALNAIDVAPGEHVTCYFENGRKPELTLVKLVINDNSGDLLANAWTLKADGATGGFSGTGALEAAPAGFDSKAVNGPNIVDNGVVYTLSEVQQDLYEVHTDWSCEGDVGGFTQGELGVATISLGYGDSATCTIVNDDLLIEFCPAGTSSGRPELLVMSYDGLSIGGQPQTYLGGPDVQPESNEVFVDPYDVNPAPAQVDIKIIPSPQGEVVWALDVDINELFSFENGKNGLVAPKTEFEIYDSVGVDTGTGDERHSNSNWIQRVGFHTSCSQPLNVGQTYGLLTVKGGILGDGTVAGPTVNP